MSSSRHAVPPLEGTWVLCMAAGVREGRGGARWRLRVMRPGLLRREPSRHHQFGRLPRGLPPRPVEATAPLRGARRCGFGPGGLLVLVAHDPAGSGAESSSRSSRFCAAGAAGCSSFASTAAIARRSCAPCSWQAAAATRRTLRARVRSHRLSRRSTMCGGLARWWSGRRCQDSRGLGFRLGGVGPFFLQTCHVPGQPSARLADAEGTGRGDDAGFHSSLGAGWLKRVEKRHHWA